MTRPRKRRNRPGGGGFGKAQTLATPVDSKLVKLLQASLQQPSNQIAQVGDSDQYLVHEDQWLIALAIRQRCQELGGRPRDHLNAAMTRLLAGRLH